MSASAVGQLSDDASWARVRTFKPRRRALSPERRRRFDELAPRWSVAGDANAASNPRDWFDRAGPIVLDVGIGNGESCIEMARADPTTNVIGVDVHTPGIANVVVAIEADQLDNVRVFHGDVFDLLASVTPGTFEGIRVFFPDPWPKVRHAGRRIVVPERMSVLVDALTERGWIHLATDSAAYAAQMREVCGQHRELSGGVIERPETRPLTRFEQRGLDAGRPICDLFYRRTIGRQPR